MGEKRRIMNAGHIHTHTHTHTHTLMSRASYSLILSAGISTPSGLWEGGREEDRGGEGGRQREREGGRQRRGSRKKNWYTCTIPYQTA